MFNKDAWEAIRSNCEKNGARLCAVTKTRSREEILALYATGQRVMGENRVQDLMDKKDQLPADIEWHLIGHLQRNKVKYIAPFIRCIHGVDSLRLLQMIDKEAEKNDRIIDYLIQFHIAEEDSKFGVQTDKANSFIQEVLHENFTHVRLRGLMGMASFVDNNEQVKNEFKKLKTIFDYYKENYFAEDVYFDTLSMGMSGDYALALTMGSTMVRVGSKLFG